MTRDNDKPVREVSPQDALRALVDHWRTVAGKVVDSGYATATRLCADELERALLSGGGDAVQTSSKADVLSAVGRLADAARRVGGAEAVGNSNAAVVASAEVERIAHEIDAMLAAVPAPAVGRDAGERDPTDGEIYGVRFGMGAVGVSTGRYTGEPAVILREPPAPGEIGVPFTEDERGPIRAVLLFPTEAQAKAVADALITPPAEAREPVGVTDACMTTLRETAALPDNAGWIAAVTPQDARALLVALAQPRDTPRDSGDAVLRAANKLAAAAMTTGGAAGADPHLQEAIDAFIAARDAAMQSPTGEPSDG